MSLIVPVELDKLLPTQEAVLNQMGVPKRAVIKDNAYYAIQEAVRIFPSYANPKGLISEITQDEFSMVYKGQGLNSKDSPLEHIYPQAEKLAVFAFTLGNKISLKIDELSRSGDVAQAGALDAAASVAADYGSEFCCQYFHKILSTDKSYKNKSVVAYSPGYCGWHVTGQKKLFQILKPEQIGVKLNESFLMTPIKSVSGILIAGKKSINYFKPKWDFCETCVTYSCLQRMKKLKN